MNPLDTAIKTVGGVTALAHKLGVGQSVVSNWRARGNVPVEYWPRIELATDGQGTRQQGRPIDWQVIWPELKQPKAA